ncbi:SusC/RagA family TonB-linked outer membrane protein [Flavobacterium sp.]|uniref:SusC/RagA family TonB-linked outer membrane protein n=1 Tax=Flavobacterium sp. TaxID=239 RepID=UPI00286E03E7|nr:SusC/RagA family TonB-linked outer membrane protein [Flavobacterium sp.]
MNKYSLFKTWVVIELPKLYYIFFLCCISGVYGQNKTITGTVNDVNGALPGVTVTVKGTGITTLSNLNGSYIITANPTDAIIFSYIGYMTIEIDINNRQTIDLMMQEDTSMLQEVTINAGYYSVKEKERTGSIARITAKDIEKQPVTNVLAAMQGRMAGVNITQTTGVPGGGFSIQIRGLNSLRNTSNEPLYIIDAIPYSSESIGSFSTSSLLGGLSSPLNSISPDNIENVEVLKDADATAIYGSRGSNGVVLITTKKGKIGKTRFTANYSKGAGRVTRFMDLMNTEQYLAMRREAYANDGITTYPANAYDLNGAWDQNRYTDWQKELTGGTAEYTNLNATVSGGNSSTQFLMSGNFAKQTTVFPGDFRYKKGNIHLTANHESENKKFRISFSGGYTVQDNNQPYLDLTRDSRLLAPNAPALYDANGNINWQNNTFNNPLRHLNGKYSALTYDLLANSVVSYNVLPNLELKSGFGFTELRHQESSTAPSTIYNPAFGIGTDNSILFLNNSGRQSWIVEPQTNWSKTYGKATVSVLAGGTFQNKTGNQIVHQALGFPSNSLIYNLAAASNVTITQNDETVYKYQAFFGRVNLKWDDTYIINLTGRRDGSSRFGPGKQFATFGAIGAAWLFTNEKVLKDNKIISFGKLRASYGTTGNDQIGDYQFLDTYTTTGVSYDGVVGLEPSRLFNPAFGWETNKKFEVALETGFLKDRIFLTAGWYSNRSSNQLVGIPLPGTTGFTSVQANLDATVENRGLEITLRSVNFHNKDFTWSTNFNISSSKNELISFPGLEASSYRNQFVIGQPINIVKVYHFTGVDPATGLYQFEDVNGDGFISEPEDKQTVKNLNPKFFGGLQNQLKYKQFQLDFLLQFVKQENYNANTTFNMPGTRSNQLASTSDHWQNAGDVSPHQMYSATNGSADEAYFYYTESDASISDASYIRLKNIALTYDVPEKWLNKMRCRISITGQNLLTFTKFKGADPEFQMYDRLPPLKVITAGMQISF